MPSAVDSDPPPPLRIVAVGDSATCGLGDTVDGQLRGWSRILRDALARGYDVSYRNLAVPGSTIAALSTEQAPRAISHRPHLVPLIVGLNDVFRADWDAAAARRQLLATASRFHACGALLLTVCFHDHAKVFGLPRPLARGLSRRIEHLNEIMLQIHHDFDTVHVDLRAEPTVYLRRAWSMDRLHPSEVGHRLLARRFAEELRDRGFSVAVPGLDPDGDLRPRHRQLITLVATGIPWLGRRARDWTSRLPRWPIPGPMPTRDPGC
jgi:lysophospholipase L1-like esterase